MVNTYLPWWLAFELWKWSKGVGVNDRPSLSIPLPLWSWIKTHEVLKAGGFATPPCMIGNGVDATGRASEAPPPASNPPATRALAFLALSVTFFCSFNFTYLTIASNCYSHWLFPVKSFFFNFFPLSQILEHVCVIFVCFTTWPWLSLYPVSTDNIPVFFKKYTHSSAFGNSLALV